MAAINDGRIPGGPTTDEVRDIRKTHLSTFVYSGQHFDYSDERFREHTRWCSSRGRRETSWELTDGQAALVAAHGFHYVDHVRLLRHDRDLLMALAERWWPRRQCFQFSFGEMTVTLEDVAQILGLPIDGEPVVMDEDLDTGDMIREYLGIEPPTDLNSKSMVKYTWLRANFLNPSQMDTHEVPVDGQRIVYCTRAYLVSLCGSILFPTGKGNEVNIRFLSLFRDLSIQTPYAWGAAALAHLYHCLDSFVQVCSSNAVSANLGGCVTILQVWAHERFPTIGRPLTTIPIESVFPVAVRWMVRNTDTAHSIPGVLHVYRPAFDALTATEVRWIVYPLPPVDAPLVQATARNLSLHNYYIIYQHNVMYHPADRVLRQFALCQNVPSEPLVYSRGRAKLALRMAALMEGWITRFTRYGVRQTDEMTQPADIVGTPDYIRWWGAPRLMHPRYEFEEPRYTPVGSEEASLRDISRRVHDVLPTFEEALQNQNIDLRRVVDDSVHILRAPPMPPIPHIYHAGTQRSVVRPRVPRQLRNWGSTTQGASTSAAGTSRPDEEDDLFDPAVLDQADDQHTQIPLTPSFPSSSQHDTQQETNEADEQLSDDEEEPGLERRPRSGLRRTQRVDYRRLASPTCYTDEQGRGCHPHRRGI